MESHACVFVPSGIGDPPTEVYGLVAEAMRLTGVQTKKAVVHLALEELVRARRRRRMLRLT